jgi:hypothetical protein
MNWRKVTHYFIAVVVVSVYAVIAGNSINKDSVMAVVKKNGYSNVVIEKECRFIPSLLTFSLDMKMADAIFFVKATSSSGEIVKMRVGASWIFGVTICNS